jgi:hypothetical protein
VFAITNSPRFAQRPQFLVERLHAAILGEQRVKSLPRSLWAFHSGAADCYTVLALMNIEIWRSYSAGFDSQTIRNIRKVQVQNPPINRHDSISLLRLTSRNISGGK